MIRGTQKPIPKIEKTIQASIHNRFDVEVVDATTGQIKQKAVGHNTICNQLYSRMLVSSGTGEGYFNSIHYGSGTGTPSSSDTSLFSFVGSVDVSNVIDGYSAGEGTGVAYLRRKGQISESTAVGKTLTEVGIGYSVDKGSLCTHAILKDMNGNPVSIEKTDRDIINIYATVFVHYNPEGYGSGKIKIVPRFDTSGSFLMTLAGHWVSQKAVPTACLFASGWGAYTSGHASCSITTDWNYTDRIMTLTMSRLAAGSGNVGGFCTLCLNTGGSSSILVETGGNWYPYSEVIGEAVGTGDGETVNFALDFPFAYDAKIYVNGEEYSGVTVRSIPNKTALAQLHWIHSVSTPDLHIPPTVPSITASPSNVSGTGIFYNPSFEIGLGSITYARATIYTSNDLQNWVELGTNTTGSTKTINISEEHRHNKYWRVGGNYGGPYLVVNYPGEFSSLAVCFDTPPADGAVITADYKTPHIAKDSNHVFDFSLVIQLNEYNEG